MKIVVTTVREIPDDEVHEYLVALIAGNRRHGFKDFADALEHLEHERIVQVISLDSGGEARTVYELKEG